MKRNFSWRTLSVGVCLQLMFVTPAVALDGVNSVERLLSQLSHTVQERNYRGLFTYEYGGTLDTLEIVHLVDDGREYERLQHLSGPTRQFVREGRSVSCASTAARLLRGGAFSPQPERQLHHHYDYNIGGIERVADRPATVVRLIPKDRFRYGLTLYIDKATSFPTKTLVISENRQVLERIQFLELDMGVAPENFEIIESAAAYQVVPDSDCPGVGSNASDFTRSPAEGSGRADEGESSIESGAPAQPLRWRVEWLPAGFVLSEQQYSASEGHQLTYTDGLASFSVFIEPASGSQQIQPGLAQRGATVALALHLPLRDHPANVSVVGEIPPVTAEQVALNIQSADSEPGE